MPTIAGVEACERGRPCGRVGRERDHVSSFLAPSTAPGGEPIVAAAVRARSAQAIAVKGWRSIESSWCLVYLSMIERKAQEEPRQRHDPRER
jgi:hypothetical protein